MMKTKQVKVLLVDDHPLIHEAAKSLLVDRDDIRLVGRGYFGEQLFPLLSNMNPTS
jgi:DNA-binding NarL/FixJ family response regulator